MACKPNTQGDSKNTHANAKEYGNRSGDRKYNKKRSNKTNKSRPTANNGVNASSANGGSSMTSYPKSAMSNDFEWYNKNPSLTLGVGQIPYPYRPGMELNLGSWAIGNAPTSIMVPHHAIPGFMALRYVPTLGSAADYQDAVNVAAREIYAKVRDAYSGTLQVTAADLMMYVGAIDSIYSEISHLKRIYGIINSYTSENYNFPDAALYAMDLNADQIRSLRLDKMGLYTAINMLIARVRKYKLPSVMDLFKRHWWMAENIFADAPSLRSQMYFFHPSGGWKIDFNEQGTKLVYVDRDESSMSVGVDGLTSLATRLLDALDASEDAYTMNGYLQRAFADVPSFTIEDLDISYQVAPQYNPEVLLQIMNFTVPSGGQDYYLTWSYTQNVDNQIITDNIVLTQNAGSISPKCAPQFLLRQDVDNPMVGDTVIATRMMATIDYSRPGAQESSYHVNFGTELPTGFRVANWSPWKQVYEIAKYYGSFATDKDDLINARIDLWNKYNHAPILYLLELNSSSVVTNVRLIGDYYNPTTISDTALADLHAVCALSELNAFGIYNSK